MDAKFVDMFFDLWLSSKGDTRHYWHSFGLNKKIRWRQFWRYRWQEFSRYIRGN